MGETNTSAITTTDVSEDPNANALEELTPRLMAMDTDDLYRDAKLDPASAKMIATATAKKVQPFKEQLVALYGPSAAARIDELPKIARAAQQAHIMAAAAAAPKDLSSMHQRVRAEYDFLITDAQGLVNRNLIRRTSSRRPRTFRATTPRCAARWSWSRCSAATGARCTITPS
ncbi:MAG: hypothetical protein AB7S26_08335 [Sandaracinaceae bacterium]